MVTVNVAQSPPVQTQKNSAEANLFLLHVYGQKKPLKNYLIVFSVPQKNKNKIENVWSLLLHKSSCC